MLLSPRHLECQPWWSQQPQGQGVTRSDERLARPQACQGQSSHCTVSTGLGRTGAQESGCPEPGGSCACPMAELSSVFLRPCLLIGEIVTERHAHCLRIASLSSLFCKPQGEATASLDRLGPSLTPRHTHTSHQNVSMYSVCRALWRVRGETKSEYNLKQQHTFL